MMKYFYACIAIVLFSSFSVLTYANNAQYEQRRNDYITTCLANFNNNCISLQAYRNLPVSTTEIDNIIALIPTKSTFDFDLVKLIRVLCLTNGTYDSKIFPAIDTIPYWLTKNEKLYGYWSENHMIMWMSSNWLLHEKFGKAIDGELDYRLRHYLRNKVNYGFYEFFSSTYAPYCLSGLLNLADFAQDVEIKSLATQAAVILLKDMLMLTNDKGVFYPTAGRNYYGKYTTPYGQNHNDLIYLLTGKGPAPTQASHSGAFLATSSLFIDSISDSWSPRLDTLYPIGHTLTDGFVINQNLNTRDRILFQWSSGAYLHPLVAKESLKLMKDSNLLDHVDFTDFKSYSFIDTNDAPMVAEYASYGSKSSVICGQDAVIFKRNGVVLSSVKDFWKGKMGYQSFPCVATVGTTPVLTASGKINKTWENRASLNANEHLPNVLQKSNIAMLMYRQEFVQPVFNAKNPEVALYFKDTDYDEVRTDSLWILGRQGESYVGVRRACISEIDSVRACPEPKGQTWVIMVGDSSMYGNFNNFQSLIQQSQFTENWSLDTSVTPWQHNYYAKIVIDTTTIEYTWRRDSVLETSIAQLTLTDLNVYPNPVNNAMNIALDEFKGTTVSVKVFNMMGQKVYEETIPLVESPVKTIPTDWTEGMYYVTMESRQKRGVEKIVVRKD